MTGGESDISDWLDPITWHLASMHGCTHAVRLIISYNTQSSWLYMAACHPLYVCIIAILHGTCHTSLMSYIYSSQLYP